MATTVLAGGFAVAVLAVAPATAQSAGGSGGAGGGGSGGAGGAGGSGFGSPANNGAIGSANTAGGGGGGGGGAAGAHGGTGGSGSIGADGGSGGVPGNAGLPDGGVGSTGQDSATAGGGGGGGAGGYSGNGAGAASISNTVGVQGGRGGAGGHGGNQAAGFASGGGGGGGGAGGYGLLVTGATSNSNAALATITGGQGGAGGGGGVGAASGGNGGNGGDGGAGLLFTTAGASLTNAGTITGGNGGAAGDQGAGGGGLNGAAGAGGAGVTGAGLTIINSGSISGGLSGDGVTQANAITFTGGANVLTLQNGFSLAGNIGVTGSVTFNQATTQFLSNVITGSGSVAQNGAGILVLSGANTYSGGTTVTSGQLILSGPGTLGATTSAVTINGGTLDLGNTSQTQNGGVTLTSGTITNGVLSSSGPFDMQAGTVGVLLTGAGALTKTTSGTIILTANNTYSGGTTISDGTLQIGNHGTSGAVTGNIVDNGTLVFNRLDTSNFSGNITGTGSVAINNNTNLSGTNTYSGATNINSGFLTVSGGSAIGNLSAVTIAAGGYLAVDTSETVGSLAGAGIVFRDAGAGVVTLNTGGDNTSTAFSGTLLDLPGGVLALTKAGTGTMTMSGANTYSGGTTLNGGTLALTGAGTLGATTGSTIVNGGTLDIGTTAQTQDSVTVNNGGTLTTSAGGSLTATTAITNNGGGTIIANGTLTGTLTSAGTVRGTGTIGTTTIAAGGTLAPGNSIGTIAVNGSLIFNAGANYNIEVSPTTADRTNVTGPANLNGNGTVNATYGAGSYVAKQYTILNSTTGVNGTFAGLTNTSLPGNVSAVLSYDTNNVYLDLTLNYMPVGGTLTSNQQSVSNALTNYFNTTGGIPVPFTALTANGLSQASGEAGTGAQQSGFDAAGQFINSVFDSAFDNDGSTAQGDNGGGPLGYAASPKISPQAAQAYAAVSPKERAASFEQRWNVWAAAYGGSGSVDGDNATGSNKTTSRIYGSVAGASYRVADTTVGFALGGAGSSFTVGGGFGSGKADMFNAALYAKRMMGAAYVSGGLGYTWQDASTDRIAGTDVLHAGFHPQALTARLEGGRRYAEQGFGVTPYAALQSTAFFMPSYSEVATSGPGTFALSYDSKTVTATRGELGARWDSAIAVSGGVFTLKAKTAWAHDWNTERAATASFQALPGASFTVNGARPSAEAALVSLCGAMDWGKGWTVSANFDGEFSANSQIYGGKGAIRYVW